MIKSILEPFLPIIDGIKNLILAMKAASDIQAYAEETIPIIKLSATLGSLLGIISLINWLRKK